MVAFNSQSRGALDNDPVPGAVVDEGGATAEIQHTRLYVWNGSTLQWERMTQPTGGGGGGGGIVQQGARDATAQAWHVDDNGGSLTVDDGGGSLTVDGFPAVQPVNDNGGSLTVDGTVTANAGTGPFPVSDNGGSLTVDAPVATPVWVRESDGAAAYVGQKTMANSKPVTIASDQSAVPVSDGGGSLTVDGTVTATGPLTDTQLRASAVPVSGPLTDTQLRASVVPVDATPSAPVATDYLPVRLTDGSLFNYNQPTYLLYQTPRVTTAAATDFFDIFNAVGSGKKVRLLGLYPVVQVTAASAIIPSFQFSLIRTSAVGTGGTAATVDGAAAPTAGNVNITRDDTTDAALPAQVTCRALPTGGATASRFLFDVWLSSEETNAATYLTQMFNWLPVGDAIKEVIAQEGEGFKIRQITATASTGTNYGWLLAFTLV